MFRYTFNDNVDYVSHELDWSLLEDDGSVEWEERGLLLVFQLRAAS